MDAASISAIGAAIAVIIAACASAWISIANSKATRADAAEAKANTAKTLAAANAAHEQSVTTAKAVDGKMEVLLDVVGKQNRAEGINTGVVQQQEHEADKAKAAAAQTAAPANGKVAP